MFRYSSTVSAAVLTPDELWRVGQVGLLDLLVQGEEAPDDVSLAARTPARTLPTLIREGVEPIVDPDLLTHLDVSPGEYLGAAPHRIWRAGVIEVAARREQDGDGLPVELAEMALLVFRECGDLLVSDDAPVSAAEDELALCEVPQGKDSQPLDACISHDDVFDQGDASLLDGWYAWRKRAASSRGTIAAGATIYSAGFFALGLAYLPRALPVAMPSPSGTAVAVLGLILALVLGTASARFAEWLREIGRPLGSPGEKARANGEVALPAS